RAFALSAVLLTLAIVSHHFTAMGAVEIMPDPARTLSGLSVSPLYLAVAVAGIALGFLGICLFSAFSDRHNKEKLALLNDAMDHMSQGLAMFDADGRLVFFSPRYAALYSLQGKIRVGCTLEELLRLRAETGTFNGDPAAYAESALASASERKTVKH